MTIEFNNNEIKELRRLRGCLDSDVIPLKKVRSLLEGLEQKINQSSAPPAPRKRNSRKTYLKDAYRVKIMGGAINKAS